MNWIELLDRIEGAYTTVPDAASVRDLLDKVAECEGLARELAAAQAREQDLRGSWRSLNDMLRAGGSADNKPVREMMRRIDYIVYQVPTGHAALDAALAAAERRGYHRAQSEDDSPLYRIDEAPGEQLRPDARRPKGCRHPRVCLYVNGDTYEPGCWWCESLAAARREGAEAAAKLIDRKRDEWDGHIDVATVLTWVADDVRALQMPIDQSKD